MKTNKQIKFNNADGWKAITVGKVYQVFVDKGLDEYIIKDNNVRLYFAINLEYYSDCWDYVINDE